VLGTAGALMVVGDRGADVARFQADLVRLGLRLPAAETGRQYFGPATRRAVLTVQRAYGLRATGVANAATLAVAAVAPVAALSPATPGGYQAPGSPVFRLPPDASQVRRQARVDGERRIVGRVYGLAGEIADELIVVATGHGLRDTRVLGTTSVEADGFEITYMSPGNGDVAVSLRVLGGDGGERLATGVRRHGTEDLEWDLVLPGASAYGPSEWAYLTASLTPLLGDVAPGDLGPPDGTDDGAGADDLSVLAGAIGVEFDAVAAWATSARLADRSAADGAPVPAEVLYAFLRQGLPLPLTASLLSTLHTDDRSDLAASRLLARLGVMDADAQRAVLARAVADNLTDPGTAGVADSLRVLRSRVAGSELLGRRGGRDGSLADVLALTERARHAEPAILAAWERHTGPAAAFWDRLVADGTIDRQTADEIRQTMTLAAITRNHLPLVRELLRRMRRGEIRSLPDLARLSRPEWQEILATQGADGTRIGTPPNLDGETQTERDELYAVLLDRELERRYPTASFAAELGRGDRSPLPSGVDVAAFLAANDDIDLARTRLDHVLADRPGALDDVGDPAALRRDLKAVQRVFKLAPTYDAVEALLGRGFDSAHRIAAMGQDAFVRALSGTPVDAIAAREIHRRAATANALALTMLGTYNRVLDGVRPAALPPPLAGAEVTASAAALPDLRALFGSLDTCACPECRSVTGPAAYFVDLLRFLGERPAVGAPNAAAVLLRRRADLGEIELSCPNTETELPYIDLVIEVLEDAVAPPVPATLDGVTGTAVSAGTVSPALRAALGRAGFAMDPDAQVLAPDSRGRWTVRDSNGACSLFVQGTSVAAVRTRQTTRATPELLALPEYVNDGAYRILAGAFFPLDLPFDLAFSQARTYLSHLGIEQSELLRLFQQDSVDSGFVTSPTEIACALLGIPRAERGLLTPALGSGPWQQVWGLNAPVPATPVRFLADRVGLTYPQLAQLLDMRFVDPDRGLAIAPRPGAAADTCDPSQLLVSGLTPEKLDRAQRFLRLWRRLDCPMWDLDKALRGLPGGPAAPAGFGDGDLTALADLERLRRRTGLDWASVLALFGDIEHLPYVDRAQDDAPAVRSLYERLFRNPLLAADSWLAADPANLAGRIADHVPALLAAFGVSDAQLRLILRDFTEDLSASLTLSRLSGIFRRVVLARAAGLSVEDFEALIGMWERDPFADPASASEFLDLAARVAAGPSVAELDYLLRHRVTPGTGVGVDDRTIAGLLRDLAAAMTALASAADGTDEVFTPPQPAGKDDLVAQKVAPAVGLDATTAALLLGLPVPGGTVTLRDVLTDPGLAATLQSVLADPTMAGVPGAATAALNEQRFPEAYRAVRLLHKCALLARAFGLRAADVSWWIAGDNALILGWLRPADLPVAASSVRNLGRWDAMRQFAMFAARLAPGPVHALDFIAALLAGPEDEDPIPALVALSSWSPSDIELLARSFGWLFDFLAGDDPDDPFSFPHVRPNFSVLRRLLLSGRNLLRLADCFAMLRRLGVDARRVLKWATAQPDRDVAEGLRQAVKAKYDLAQWEQIAQPLQDMLREQRRDALVSWLVTHPTADKDWADVAGLYGHFLIDVEMSACMRTSRIKQAAASAQLFVQRCLLGAEPAVPADPRSDPKWQQWTWMRRYRTWEANRQIFLYPENWLEPELRHEKSPMFRQLERDLLQTDLTADAADQAYAAYLDRLAAVANLEIRAIAYTPAADQSADVVHVIGRGRGRHGAAYYYRRQIGRARWTPWEDIGLKIEGDHLVAALDNDRLLLLWPQFLAQAEAPATVTTPSAASSVEVPAPDRHWEVRLNWSGYQGGTWTPAVLAQPALITYDDPANVDFRVLPYVNDPPGVKVELLGESPDPARFAPQGYEFYRKSGSQLVVLRNPRPVSVLANVMRILAPPQAQYASGLLLHTSGTLSFGYDMLTLSLVEGGLGAPTASDSVAVLGRISPKTTFTVLRSDVSLPPSWSDHAFVWDEARAYHVDYDRTQTVSSTRGTSNNPVFVSTWALRFAIHYHPFVDAFVATVDAHGPKGLYDREVQLRTGAFDFASYAPTEVVQGPLPIEDVDFSYSGAYAPYNWELFFHVPVLIGNRLAAQQRYADAVRWYQAVFDPTGPVGTAGADPDTPQQRFWITKPFYQTSTAEYRKQQITAVLQSIAAGDAQLLRQVEQWQGDPFNPHLIAGLRTVAYQKYVVVRYVQTLLAWGDQLFAENTIESLNEATQLYVMAASLLGPRPQTIAHRDRAVPLTYYQLARDGIEPLVESLTAIENLLPVVPAGPVHAADAVDAPLVGGYFGVPGNDRLLGLWDAVADRLFRIRHCQNIAGQVQQLPLFEPPIDPGLLAKAVAAGVDIASATALAGVAPPLYRFRSTVARARELCAQVRALGAAMLAALEKRDADALVLLRSEHEVAALTQIRAVKEQQVDEALAAREAYQAARTVAELRRDHYTKLIADGVNTREQTVLDRNAEARRRMIEAIDLDLISAALRLIPNLIAGATGFGGSPTVTAMFGGGSLGPAGELAAMRKKGEAAVLQIDAGLASTVAGHIRRTEEWELQRQIAERELTEIDRQLAAADLRHAIAARELANHNAQTARIAAEDEYLRGRFTGQELYGWMITQLSTVYQQSYQLAFELARRAETCYRYELGLDTSNEIQFDAWDGLRRGLLAGERLSLDVERLEASFDRQNTRRLELTKHVSLAQIDPAALLQLRQNGQCTVDIPEAVFDLDYPGHYLRRLRHVQVTIPCVAGPYTTLACTLTLTNSSWRTDATLTGGDAMTGYVRLGATDRRFRDESGMNRSIATSSGQRDGGVFDGSTRDDRYLPFEGAGAISSWTIRLNHELPQIDLTSITDVILHLEYTAVDADQPLRDGAVNHLRAALRGDQPIDGSHDPATRRGLFRIFDLKREFPDQWHRFRQAALSGATPEFILTDLPDRLPLFTKTFQKVNVRGLAVAAQVSGPTGIASGSPPPDYQVQVTTPAGAMLTLNLAADGTFAGLVHATQTLTGGTLLPGTWKLHIDRRADPGSAPPPDAVGELFLIVNYTLTD
jgi:peptidoglycan hydrolase-like protein with peptidoglycan-binding domain